MGQFEDLKLFLTVVDQGSIARAAEALGIAKSAVSRRLGQLEARYDMRLVDRQPGTWLVTEAGKELYQRAGPMLAEADDLERDFTHVSVNPAGPLRVTIAHQFGMTFLKPMLFKFIEDHPEIELTLDFDDRTIDLERENYDLAIRITAADLDATSQHRLGTTRHGMFASPDYLSRFGLPTLPRHLSQHALLHYGGSRRAVWAFKHEGKPVRVAFKPALNSNAGAFLLDAAVGGGGIIRLPDFMVAPVLETGRLVPVLPEAEFTEYTIHLAHAANRRLNKRMRAFVEAVRAECALCMRP